MTRSLLLLPVSLCMALSSCVVADGNSIKALGGKGAYQSDGQGGFKMVWNAEKSFYHGTVLVGGIAASAASVATSVATETTARHGAAQVTKQHATTQATQRIVVKEGAAVVKNADGIRGALEIAPVGKPPSAY